MNIKSKFTTLDFSPVASDYAAHAAKASLHAEVKTITTPQEIEPIREDWKCLKGVRDSDIDFFLEFTGASEHVLRPHIIALYRNRALDALLVGRVEKHDLTRARLRPAQNCYPGSRIHGFSPRE
jgi:hypothetical protein